MSERVQAAYRTLGVAPGVSDAELRAVYRRLAQLHHPDHNAGSAESERRFEAVQEAYATVLEARRSTSPRDRSRQAEQPRSAQPPPADAPMERRVEELERELREAHAARERARRAAREAAAGDEPRRPSDEELGYVRTDDSFSKIFADLRDELAARLSEARGSPAAERLADLLDEFDPRHR